MRMFDCRINHDITWLWHDMHWLNALLVCSLLVAKSVGSQKCTKTVHISSQVWATVWINYIWFCMKLFELAVKKNTNYSKCWGNSLVGFISFSDRRIYVSIRPPKIGNFEKPWSGSLVSSFSLYPSRLLSYKVTKKTKNNTKWTMVCCVVISFTWLWGH